MLNSQTRNKIYALASITVIVLSAASFILVVNFLIDINARVFRVDERLIKEKTTSLDMADFNWIKEKVDPASR